jgi:hypothetical protein
VLKHDISLELGQRMLGEGRQSVRVRMIDGRPCGPKTLAHDFWNILHFRFQRDT